MWHFMTTCSMLLAMVVMAASWCVSPCHGMSAHGTSKVLVVLSAGEASVEKQGFTTLLANLKERNLKVTVKAPKDAVLVENEERLYDHALFLVPKLQDKKGPLHPALVIDFVGRGGNVVLGVDSSISEQWREMSEAFGLAFDDAGTVMMDHAHDLPATSPAHAAAATSSWFKKGGKASPVRGTLFSASNYNSVVSDRVLLDKDTGKRPGAVLYHGIGHKIAPKNPLVRSILTAHTTSLSLDPMAKEAQRKDSVTSSYLQGDEAVLISVLQARNNARIAFSGSIAAFTDAFIKADGYDNKFMTEELTKWAFQEKSVLRMFDYTHHKVNETEQQASYRVKDDVEITLSLSEYHHDAWHPFVATDLQATVTMLDPYVRATLRRTTSTPTMQAYSTGPVTLPDRYGVFRMAVTYRRIGYSFITTTVVDAEERDVVVIVPFRHDAYPRFLPQAFPYYAATGSAMVGFLGLCMVALFAGEGKAGPTSAKVKTT